MITIEDRLRAAARAAADTVADDSARPLRLPPRGRHPGRLGWSHHRTLIVPLAAAAAVIALITASVFATHAVLPGSRRPAPGPPSAALPTLADGLPAYFLEYPISYQVIAEAQRGTAYNGSSPGPARSHKYEILRIVATATGKVAATIKIPGYVTAIAASREAFFAAVVINGGARFYEIRHVRPGFTAMVLLPIRPDTARIAYMAVSPGGAKLAYSTLVPHGATARIQNLVVASTADGSQREWTIPASYSTGYMGPMNWLANGRTLAFNWVDSSEPGLLSMRLVDTAARGSNLMAGRVVLPSVYKNRPFESYSALSPIGQVVVGEADGSAASHVPQGSLLAYSTATGQPTVLYPVSPPGRDRTTGCDTPMWISNAGSEVLTSCIQEVKATPPIRYVVNTVLINHGRAALLPWLDAATDEVTAFP
jgi:hypothetical protein